jgi:RsiW-degrading membrane proteinase PrsW (M82 family)
MYLVILAFIAIAASLVWYLLWHDHGRRLPVEALWLACCFGCLAMMIAALGEGRFVPSVFLHYPQAFPLTDRVGYFLGIAAIEEVAKFLPLAVYIYRKAYFREYVDGVIYFAICGLTFGLGENILYTMTYGAKVGLMRLLLTPFLHAATTAILGFYLMRLRLHRRAGVWALAAAMAAVILLHGLYDFGVGSNQPFLLTMALAITLALTQGLFLVFIEANARDRLAWLPALGGHFQPAGRYCPACGQANHQQGNFCEVCGHGL